MKLKIWDSPHNMRIGNTYLRRANGIIFVYDITKEQSFLNICQRIESFFRDGGRDHREMILVGTKCDLSTEREVTVDGAKNLADRYGVKFLETSAKMSIDVEAVFNIIVHDLCMPTIA